MVDSVDARFRFEGLGDVNGGYMTERGQLQGLVASALLDGLASHAEVRSRPGAHTEGDLAGIQVEETEVPNALTAQTLLKS